MIAAGDSNSRFSAYALLSTRPFRWIGDASYSIYLWHWPIVVFYLVETDTRVVGPVAGAILILGTLGISWFSKANIEDRFRHGSPEMAKRWQGLGLAAGGVAPAMLAVVLLGIVLGEEAKLEDRRQQYAGARALTMEPAPQDSGDYIPSLTVLKQDRSLVYANGCHLGFDSIEPMACNFGDVRGEFRVFLVGDSHAVNWLPALGVLAKERGWSLTSYTKSSCALMPVLLSRSGKPYTTCFEWGKRVREIIAAEKPDLVIHAHMHTVYPYADEGEKRPSVRRAIVDLWRELESQGVQVVAVADTPRWRVDPVRCLAADRDCSVPLASVKAKDPFVDAKRRESRVGLVDMTDIVCPKEVCSAVIGNVVVWRDPHHLTASYSASMSGILGDRLDKAIEGSTAVAKAGSRRKP